MFKGFNNKQIEVTLKSTNVAMAASKEVKDTLFWPFEANNLKTRR